MTPTPGAGREDPPAGVASAASQPAGVSRDATPRLRTEGLLLAAGAGRRLGRGPKALLRHRGATLVHLVAAAMVAGGCARVTVVCGAGARDVGEVMAGEVGVRCVENRDWPDGMGASLRCGLEAIGAGVDVLVMPVDRPGISAAEIDRVVRAHRPGAITAAAHRDHAGRLRRGHPVLLDARWTSAAAASAHGDVGARELLAARPEIIHLVDCSDLDDGIDVDVPDELARLRP